MIERGPRCHAKAGPDLRTVGAPLLDTEAGDNVRMSRCRLVNSRIDLTSEQIVTQRLLRSQDFDLWPPNPLSLGAPRQGCGAPRCRATAGALLDTA
jgi:hypothetical protein